MLQAEVTVLRRQLESVRASGQQKVDALRAERDAATETIEDLRSQVGKLRNGLRASRGSANAGSPSPASVLPISERLQTSLCLIPTRSSGYGRTHIMHCSATFLPEAWSELGQHRHDSPNCEITEFSNLSLCLDGRISRHLRSSGVALERVGPKLAHVGSTVGRVGTIQVKFGVALSNLRQIRANLAGFGWVPKGGLLS